MTTNQKLTFLGKELKTYQNSSYYSINVLDEEFKSYTFSASVELADQLSLLVPKEDYIFTLFISKGLINGRECLKGYITSIVDLEG